MRHAVRGSWLFGALALLAVATLGGCQNPLDPIDKSDKIQGLSFIDFASTWDRWDADAQFDGVVVSLDYYNEFGDSLAFHDKSHSVVIEMWSQQDIGTLESTFLAKDRLLFSRTIEFSNSDDDIRIPIEAYEQAIRDAGIADETTGEMKGFMVVRVFPPQEFPRPELMVAQPDITFFKPEVAEDTPNL